MKITCIEYPTEQDWIACKERALVTVGLNVKNAPDESWKKSILKARHSPIRRLRFSFKLEGIPSWVAVHLVRHVHAQPYVRSQRNDRQSNYDRTKAPQDAPVDMIWDMNAEELMVIANKRLCRQASDKTRELVRMICDEVVKTNPEFADFLVPMCQYVGECKEMYPCGERGENG
jgi:thymidylate synthase ThyX